MSAALESLADQIAREHSLRAIAFSPPRIQAQFSILNVALEKCLHARNLIRPEQDKIQALIDAAEDETERAFREYQYDLVEWRLTRAAEIAEKRVAYLSNLKTQDDYDAELAKCEADTEHWFEYYAWGKDPRKRSPLPIIPFALFEDFQHRFVQWLERLVFEERASGLVEKARDMGATETGIKWIVKQWRFNADFAALLASANEDLVDSKKDPDTLFEKVRFQIRMFPNWMLPKGFDVGRDMPYMNIANPENGAVILGDAPTTNVGRQRRCTCVLADEFSAWPHGGYPQYISLSQTTDSVLLLATPQGKFNKYSEERHSGHANVFEMDWREHPWKDIRWYEGLPHGYSGPPMTAQAIAQEIDRDYEASQPGKVFKDWQEEYLFITQEELIEAFKPYGLDHEFRDVAGNFRVPIDWNWGRAQDIGSTEAHQNITMHGAKPAERYPYHDTFFLFSEYVAETGAAVGQIVPELRKIERDLGFVQRPLLSLISHEADEERKTYKKHGIVWSAWNTDYNLGIPQIREWLMLIDKTQPNPYRPVLMGRTRIIFVCTKEIRFVFNDTTGKHYVTPSLTSKSFKVAREQFPGYHYPPEEAGKPLAKQRPLKVKDDSIDPVRAFATVWGPSVKPKTHEQKIEEKLSPTIQIANIPNLPVDQQNRALQSRLLQLDMIQQEEAAKNGNGRIKIPSVKFRK